MYVSHNVIIFIYRKKDVLPQLPTTEIRNPIAGGKETY